MKKKLIGVVMLSSLFMVGCGNKALLDTKWTFSKAKIYMGNEAIEVEVKSWKDYDDTTIQIEDVNGKVYLTDLKNVLLINE